jgi:pilus assembly protein CpaF
MSAERRGPARPGAALTGFGPLDPLLADAAVSEVMVNGAEVWIERGGRLEQLPLRLAATELHRLVERVVGPAGVRVDRASPLADVRLGDGSRAHVVLPPIAPDGPCITIRRFTLLDARLSDFTDGATARRLEDAVRCRVDIVVAGATATGKTTFLNALARAVPRDERIVTVEDVAELRLDHPHVVRLETRRSNADGIGEVTVRTLVRNALRMRPDRIVVGEVRGGEVLDMAQAMNSGHRGSMSTCHANSPQDLLRRLEAMAVLDGGTVGPAFARDQIAGSLGLVVQLGRDAGGRRRVVDVVEGAELR